MKDIKEMSDSGYPRVEEIQDMVKSPQQLEDEMYTKYMDNLMENITQKANQGQWLIQSQVTYNDVTKKPLDRLVSTLNELGFKTELNAPPEVDGKSDPNTLLQAAQHNNMYLLTVSWEKETKE